MIINRANLAMLSTGFRANFQSGLSAYASQWGQYASLVPSTTAQELYPWLDKIPGMRKWIGERQIKNISAGAYTIKNDSYEDTVSVKRTDIEDDRYGIYTTPMTLLGDAAARQPDELVFSGIKTGFSTNCFDGQFFFDTDHPVLDANGTEVAVSNMQAGAGAPWFLLDTSKPLKPFIFQERQKPRFIGLDRETDERAFMRDEYVYGADARNAFGFGFWQTAFGSRATLNAANFEAAYDAMISFKGDFGVPLAIKPTVLVTGPANRGAAETILKKMNLVGGESNLNWDRVKLDVQPWLA